MDQRFLKFPPFYTLQTNEATRNKQLEIWQQLFIAYCNDNKIYKLNYKEFKCCDLFCSRKHTINDTINNPLLTPDCVTAFSGFIFNSGIDALMQTMLKNGILEWTDKHRNALHIWSKSVEELSSSLKRFALNKSFKNTICTLDELVRDYPNEEFHQLESEMMLRVLKLLERQRVVNILVNEDGYGVKFL
ncbi:hypothetical protein GJ496_002893 [Pomphorhynchus laevis]|nr:hypothetical protein GJ496_002893 [Pomphorhynchus laevis]